MKIGSEQCLCLVDSDDECIMDPRESDCWHNLCPQDHYCYDGTCYPECLDLPDANTDSCYCHHEVCYIYEYEMEGLESEKYCNLSSGCTTFQECPQDFTLFDNGTYCDCYGTLMDATMFYCLDNATIPLPDEDCPPIPDMAPETDCLCMYSESETDSETDSVANSDTNSGANSVANSDTNSEANSATSIVTDPPPHPDPPNMVCEAGLMCNTTLVTCEPRPDPCLSLPDVAGPHGCYCEVAHAICNEGKKNKDPQCTVTSMKSLINR